MRNSRLDIGIIRHLSHDKTDMDFRTMKTMRECTRDVWMQQLPVMQMQVMQGCGCRRRRSFMLYYKLMRVTTSSNGTDIQSMPASESQKMPTRLLSITHMLPSCGEQRKPTPQRMTIIDNIDIYCSMIQRRVIFFVSIYPR